MSNISKFIQGVGAIIKSPRLVSAVLHDQRYWKSKFLKRFGHADLLPVVPFTSLVPGDATLDNYTFSGDSSMITDLLLLKHLAMRDSVRSYCEIGTWRGESARAVSPHVDRIVTIDLPADTMEKQGVDDLTITQIGMYLDGLENVKLVLGDSTELDYKGLGGPFDLVFIDGDHRAEYVERDTRNVFKHLCHENTIVIWHDYGIDPENVRWEVYYGIVEGAGQSRVKELVHIGQTKVAVYGLDDNLIDAANNESPSWRIRLTGSRD